jgi:hypothetical protein
MLVASIVLSRRLHAGGQYAVRNGKEVSSRVPSSGDKDVVVYFNGLFVLMFGPFMVYIVLVLVCPTFLLHVISSLVCSFCCRENWKLHTMEGDGNMRLLQAQPNPLRSRKKK